MNLSREALDLLRYTLDPVEEIYLADLKRMR